MSFSTAEEQLTELFPELFSPSPRTVAPPALRMVPLPRTVAPPQAAAGFQMPLFGSSEKVVSLL